ncbi:hypothetical protein Tco_1283852 [Tanacetum coccineum]
MHTTRGDGVASIKRRRRNLSGDDVRKMTTVSGLSLAWFYAIVGGTNILLEQSASSSQQTVMDETIVYLAAAKQAISRMSRSGKLRGSKVQSQINDFTTPVSNKFGTRVQQRDRSKYKWQKKDGWLVLSPRPSLTHAPFKEGNLVRLLAKALIWGKQKHHSGFSAPDHLRAISIDMEQFIQWIYDYELPYDLFMPKTVSTYKGLDERHSFIGELKQRFPTNVMAYKTRKELKGLQKDDMIKAIEIRSTALQLHHQAMKGFDFYKSL